MADQLSREEVLSGLRDILTDIEEAVAIAEENAEEADRVGFHFSAEEERMGAGVLRTKKDALEAAIALLQQEQEKRQDENSLTGQASDLTDAEVEDNLRDMWFDEVKRTRDGRLQVTGDYDRWRWFMDYCRK